MSSLDNGVSTSVSLSRGVARRRRIDLRYVLFELLFSRALPSAFFLFFLAVKAVGVERRIAAAASPVSFADASYVLQQGLTTLFYTLVVVLFIIRRPVVGQRSSLLGAAVALAGTFLIIVPVASQVQDDPTLLLASSAIVLVGTAFTLWSLAALGRCFGLFPEARGLVIRGPMRIKLSIEAEVQASLNQALKALVAPRTCPDRVVARRVGSVGTSGEHLRLVGSLLALALSTIFDRSLACLDPLA
jgi:hypothetical protein